MCKREYYIHTCFNGNKHVCSDIYKVSRSDYVNWEYYFSCDCFDEVEDKKESHLYLDEGDCDDPIDVITYYHDLTV